MDNIASTVTNNFELSLVACAVLGVVGILGRNMYPEDPMNTKNYPRQLSTLLLLISLVGLIGLIIFWFMKIKK